MGFSWVEKYFECRITLKTETGHLLLNYFYWITWGFVVVKKSAIMLSDLLWGGVLTLQLLTFSDWVYLALFSFLLH